MAQPTVVSRQPEAPARPPWWNPNPTPAAPGQNFSPVATAVGPPARVEFPRGASTQAGPFVEASRLGAPPPIPVYVTPSAAILRSPPQRVAYLQPPIPIPAPSPLPQPLPWIIGWHPPAAATVASPQARWAQSTGPAAGGVQPLENLRAPPADRPLPAVGERPAVAPAGCSSAAWAAAAALVDKPCQPGYSAVQSRTAPLDAAVPAPADRGCSEGKSSAQVASLAATWNHVTATLAVPNGNAGPMVEGVREHAQTDGDREKASLGTRASAGPCVPAPALGVGARKPSNDPPASAEVASGPNLRPGSDSGAPSAEKVAQWMNMSVCPLTLVCFSKSPAAAGPAFKS